MLQNRTLGCLTKLQMSYSVQTSPVLRLLLNQPSQGLWQLQVVDCAFGDTGTLKSWELTLGV
jgi:subtilisin-like proprotein convertase family protein